MLVVDLDRTLVRTGLFGEAVLGALARQPRSTLLRLPGLLFDRRGFTGWAVETARLSPASLPYDPAVLEAVRLRHGQGEEARLVSHIAPGLAAKVATHLGCFDEGGPADLPVTEIPRSPSGGLRPLLKAMRPHQWLKNLLVFLPVLAAHTELSALWLTAFFAFLAFSLTASAVYLINDLLDLAADRAHPRKRARPFAAGLVPLRYGLAAVPILLGSALVLSILLLPPFFLAVLGAYTVCTFAYSFWLKRELVIDIVMLAGLYALRVLAGGAATGLDLSEWMLAFSGFIFLCLAAMKRLAELKDGEKTGKTRAAGRAYEVGDIPVVTMMGLASGYIAVLVMALYLSGAGVAALYKSPRVLFLACPVLLYWVSYIVMVTHRGRMSDDPMVFALKDPVSLFSGAAMFWIAAFASAF